ncbi:hypothetical protein TREES_T100021837 [Tupaia chinensis]|uniref:Uncharacterized protein n=1 Tax=Tupaia chinensis TaxID=246437 RepID=L9JCV9_TUPCH|nr:hypothetical protein TREES_T100021837 [Tupaia chinensis]
MPPLPEGSLLALLLSARPVPLCMLPILSQTCEGFEERSPALLVSSLPHRSWLLHSKAPCLRPGRCALGPPPPRVPATATTTTLSCVLRAVLRVSVSTEAQTWCHLPALRPPQSERLARRARVFRCDIADPFCHRDSYGYANHYT